MLNINRSGYYAWLKRSPSISSQANACLDKKIIYIFEIHAKHYGVPRIIQSLKRKEKLAIILGVESQYENVA